ncbi:MAG: extracellular solute-binding protein [Anaerolineaceae bacterium]|nr:extracellular solute-binding protein [Anaerolineaceae bacterium]
MLFGILLTACSSTTELPQETIVPDATEAAVEPANESEITPTPTTVSVGGNCTGTPVRWYIGLGAGGNPEEIEKETAFLEKFNDKYGDQYCLTMDVVQNATAYDVLKTQIASGDVPDIVGPVGVRGLWSFEGAWLDLTELMEKNNYDSSDFNPALLDFYKLGPMGQVGIPFAVYPSALWYNKDLFDEAGLAYPPHKFGDLYEGKTWDFAALRDIAIILTVDNTGKTPADDGFDPTNIVQFGYDAMWTDVRGKWTFFGAGSFNDNGKAVMPDVWREAAHWYYDGMWTDYFIPNDNYVNSDYLTQGNTFNSGHVAMAPIHTWYTCCAGNVPNWDVAAIPSYDGTITAKLHADTFGILKGTKNPDASFAVLSLMLGEFAPDLIAVYGAFPARGSLQTAALDTMKANFPNVDLDVFVQGLNYPDNPNHESGMPNFLKASDTYTAFGSNYQTAGDLDLDAEIDALIAQLQDVFDETK